MRKLLFFASMALFTSCATHKYGCDVSIDDKKNESTYLVIKPRLNKDGNTIRDSVYITEKNENGRRRIVNYKMVNYKPEASICRGHGKVTIVDTLNYPKSYLIKIDGVLLRDNTIITDVKYLIVYEGRFYKSLTPYINTDVDVYFEAEVLFPNVYDGPDIQHSVIGCIEKVEYLDNKRNDIILIKYNK